MQPGDIYGFIGHNGAGKTTTIKCVVGIHDFDEGEILVDKISVKKEPMKCKSILAYIPDNPDLYEYLTGIQYLNFIADIFELSEKEREKRIKEEADNAAREKERAKQEKIEKIKGEIKGKINKANNWVC